MATADVFVSAEGTETALERTKSQVVKQLKVQQVTERLEGQQQLVRELLAAVEAPCVDLKDIMRHEKAARNIGEDLLEDMLKLDSLGGLYQEDRKVRKRALAQLEELVDKVDAAKSQLRQKRQQAEAQAESETQETSQGSEETPSPATPPSATPATPPSSTAVPSPAEEDFQEEDVEEEEEEPAEKEDVEMDDERPADTQTAHDSIQDIRQKLKLQCRELAQAYVVSAKIPAALDAEDVELKLDGDVLRISGVARPTAQDVALLRRWKRRELYPEDFAAHGFGGFQEGIRIPADVDVNSIQASCRDGQLQLVLPRRLTARFPRQCRTARQRPSMFGSPFGSPFGAW